MAKKRAKTSKRSLLRDKAVAPEASLFGDEPNLQPGILSHPYSGELLLQEFENQNDTHPPLPVEIEGFHIQFFQVGYHLEMHVVIPEDARSVSAKAWRLIKFWRKRLTVFQGKRNELIESLDGRHPAVSYSNLAKELNADLQRDLEAAHNDNKAGEPGWSGGLVKVKYVLGSMRFSQQETERIISEALNNLQNKKPAFNYGHKPITRDHVRDCLDTWRERSRRTRHK